MPARFMKGVMSNPFASWLRVGAIIFFLGLAGCQGIQVESEPPVTTSTVPDAPAQPPDQAPPPEPPQPIAVLVTSDSTVYADVATALTDQLQVPQRTFFLDAVDTRQVIDEIQRAGIHTVVSIGSKAFDVAQDVAGANVIHAQVFDGATSRDRGVAAFPPATLQLAKWKAICPTLSHVGLIASGAFAETMAEFVEAGSLHGIDVLTREVATDREALFEFRRLTPSIDGFVLLPDATVLSPDVIKRLISHSNTNDIQVLVYSDPIYRLGATLRVAPVSDDVAAGIVELLHNTHLARRELTRFRLRQRGSSDEVEVVEQVAQR